ncbi:hypothetical protein JX265_011936 [Neoarthrinium moseri]|uniref:Transmembrane protein n=1 Tax=Neoarthrinium moseri TaxID=1658444 RepID=A0A9Q0AJ20_9PEZI|nr:hypothetical protein JX265_011936 [Neoarthrinium moseri]
MDAVLEDQRATALTGFSLQHNESRIPTFKEHEGQDVRPQRLRIFHKTDWFLETTFVMDPGCIAKCFYLGVVDNFKSLPHFANIGVPQPAEVVAFGKVKEAESVWLEDLRIFYNARRGPLGALKFFWKAPSKSWLPWVGCFVTLVAIAVDPFTQQILNFEPRLTETFDADASVGASQVYDLGATGDPSSEGLTFYNPLQAAITGALYDQARLPAFVCQGIICDYPTFASLGVSSNCQDVRQTTVVNCTGQDEARENCVLTTPSQSVLFASTSFSDRLGFGHTRLNTSLTRNPSREIGAVLSLSVVRLPDVGTRDTWMDGMEVHDCLFRLSAIEYANWRMVNGTILPGLRTPYTMNITQPGSLTGYTVLDTAFQHNRTFYINFMDSNNMVNMLEEAFAPVEPNVVTLKNVPLYISEGIPTTIAKISDAISDRMISGPNFTEKTGRVYTQETFITVHWHWISLPASLVFAACGLLAAVMLLTHQADQLIWKSSLTPLLMTEVSYPLSTAHQRPIWTNTQLKTRTTVIANHLTR